MEGLSVGKNWENNKNLFVLFATIPYVLGLFCSVVATATDAVAVIFSKK